jgi:transposase
MDEIEALRARVAQLENQHATLLQKRVTQLEQQNAMLLQKIDELEKRLAKYENSNTPPSAGGGYPKREPSGKKQGAQLGHEGTTREQKTPDEVMDAPPLTECPKCHHALGDPLYSIPFIFEDIQEPPPAKTKQINKGVYNCPHCGEFTVAEDPQCPKEGRFGYNVMIEAVMMRFDQRLPLRKIQQAFRKQYKLDVTPATIWAFIRRVAAAGEAEFREIFDEMRKQAAVNADETSRNVEGRLRWLWIFISSKFALYLAGRGRGRDVVKEVLGEDYRGVLGCDGWRVYVFIKMIQRCWAHLLRESKHLAERVGGVACQIHESLKKLFATADEMRSATLSDAARQKIHDELNQTLLSVIQLAKEHESTLKFGGKIENGVGHWFTAVLHPEIELTNNSAERALREPVIQRKISGSLRSDEGAHALEVIMTLLATWNLQGKDPRHMLLKTLQRS